MNIAPGFFSNAYNADAYSNLTRCFGGRFSSYS
jgi:hypothetical protein